jgi:citrate lyase subunit beta/citryl-CoA lyase
VTRLALGAIDLTGDVDADLDSPIVAHAMVQLVLASRAARITAPLDSPATAIKDRAAVELSARVARATGFGGKLCIHPAQLDPVRTAFRPTQDQISWARRVVDQISTAGEAAVQLDGQMIDKPVIDKARRILCRAGQDAS